MFEHIFANIAILQAFTVFVTLEKNEQYLKVWWITVFLICLTACIFSIYGVYKKWDGSPVIVNFANQGTPIYRIPFPAVTICPESKSVQNLFSYTKIMQKKLRHRNTTQDEDLKFEYMALVCKYHEKINYTNPKTFPDEFLDLLNTIKPNLIKWNCMYLGEKYDCNQMFVKILTDEGICYTFNMLDRTDIYRDKVLQYKDYQRSLYKMSEWSVEHGYTQNAQFLAYPRRALLAGASNGLTLNILTPKDYLDYACRKNSLQGYKVILHSPMRIPRPSQQYFRVPLDQSVVGAVQPVMISTSDRVQMYHPKRRGCYFPSERHLKFFKIYTSLNCKLECLTNYTLSRCQCVNFFMPRENGTKMCGTGKITCMREAERFLQAKDLYLKLSDNKSLKKNSQCDCLPICTDTTYEVETSQSDWNWKMTYSAHGTPWPNDTHLSSLTIFFKSDTFITSERNELYGPIDFLANFGGLLGLFTGFSVLSLMEILYFLSVRLICNNRLYGFWAGSEI
ncbi:pickpocket protein 28-like [Tribolium madens]|uniref:pickpocket protein 28-like n=1 Tax=Tribolium madens TaxID=41895 RepID=UPI001CF7204E|nr:pickpocket protein 28-like [Tribolium madens]